MKYASIAAVFHTLTDKVDNESYIYNLIKLDIRPFILDLILFWKHKSDCHNPVLQRILQD